MGKHGPNEAIEYNGKRYRRYPQSPNRRLRLYFVRTAKANGRQWPEYLHRTIWEEAHGPVPAGHHVHHRDENTLNNDISNLSLITATEHLRQHASDPGRVAESRRNIHLARKGAAEWHRSPDGHAWHSEHARRVMGNR